MTLDFLIREIDESSRIFKDSFSDLSGEDLNFKPNASTWSIGQVIDHITTINDSYFPIFDQLERDELPLPFHAKIPFVTRFFGNVILNSVQPKNKKKTTTFPIWEPQKSDIDPSIIDQFIEHHEQLKEKVTFLWQRGLESKIISSPANKNIVYSVSKAMEIIITHEKRHFNQAYQLKQQLKESSEK